MPGITCPRCKTEYSDDNADACPQCSLPRSEVEFCSSCGKPIMVSTSFCGNCGAARGTGGSGPSEEDGA